MGQDTKSGQRANSFGHFMAGKISETLDIPIVDYDSNETRYEDETAVIKSAGINTHRFGITRTMLERISIVLLAKKVAEPDHYLIYKVKISDLEKRTISKSPRHNGRVISFSVSEAKRKGTLIGEANITMPADYLEVACND